MYSSSFIVYIQQVYVVIEQFQRRRHFQICALKSIVSTNTQMLNIVQLEYLIKWILCVGICNYQSVNILGGASKNNLEKCGNRRAANAYNVVVLIISCNQLTKKRFPLTNKKKIEGKKKRFFWGDLWSKKCGFLRSKISPKSIFLLRKSHGICNNNICNNVHTTQPFSIYIFFKVGALFFCQFFLQYKQLLRVHAKRVHA